MLARRQLSLAGWRRKVMAKPDPSLLDGVVSPRVLDAMRVASSKLNEAGVRHVVAGGLAVGANGYPRATSDVDLLVGDEAFTEHPGGVMTLRPGVPFQVGGIAIDLISAESGEVFLEDALNAPAGSFLEAPPLIYLKLKSSRLRDQADIVELVKRSIDIEVCRTYLRKHAPDMVERFDTLVARAESE
jgi:hypothetical protein